MSEALLTQFASAAAGEHGGLFEALGIDWKMLTFQIIGFLILVFVMGKWVYPVLIKSVDARQEKIEAGTKAAEAAEAKARQAEADIEKLMDQARKDAASIVATAHDEASVRVSEAESKAKQSAERIVASAHEQIEKDIVKARQTLEKDTVKLIALATEKVVGKTVTKSVDDTLIKQSLKEVR